MNVSPPKWRFEWNPNTIAILVGFAAGFVAWGYTLSELTTGREQNAEAISRLETRVSALEVSTRTLDNHELRLTTVEVQARDTTSAMRSVEQSLNSLAADLRVMREIIERMDRTQAVVAGR